MKRGVIGLDLSLTETGFATPEAVYTEKTPASKIKGMDRYAKILELTMWALEVVKDQRPLVVIEGYSYGSRGRAVFDIGELGGIIRYKLWTLDVDYIEVPPSTLKILACGKGNVGKTEVVVAARERLDYDGTNDNEADALWLREFGLQLLGQSEITLPKSHMRALEKVSL